MGKTNEAGKACACDGPRKHTVLVRSVLVHIEDGGGCVVGEHPTVPVVGENVAESGHLVVGVAVGRAPVDAPGRHTQSGLEVLVGNGPAVEVVAPVARGAASCICGSARLGQI